MTDTTLRALCGVISEDADWLMLADVLEERGEDSELARAVRNVPAILAVVEQGRAALRRRLVEPTCCRFHAHGGWHWCETIALPGHPHHGQPPPGSPRSGEPWRQPVGGWPVEATYEVHDRDVEVLVSRCSPLGLGYWLWCAVVRMMRMDQYAYGRIIPSNEIAYVDVTGLPTQGT